MIGYSDEIEQVDERGKCHDLKLGGLTTFEALACRVPIIADVITDPMPQEAGTARSDRATRRRCDAQARQWMWFPWFGG